MTGLSNIVMANRRDGTPVRIGDIAATFKGFGRDGAGREQGLKVLEAFGVVDPDDVRCAADEAEAKSAPTPRLGFFRGDVDVTPDTRSHVQRMIDFNAAARSMEADHPVLLRPSRGAFDGAGASHAVDGVHLVDDAATAAGTSTDVGDFVAPEGVRHDAGLDDVPARTASNEVVDGPGRLPSAIDSSKDMSFDDLFLGPRGAAAAAADTLDDAAEVVEAVDAGVSGTAVRSSAAGAVDLVSPVRAARAGYGQWIDDGIGGIAQSGSMLRTLAKVL